MLLPPHPKVKPEAVNAVISKLLMMGVEVPETC
jgi:hypothetical protein